MTRIFDEKYENTSSPGFDEAGWTKSVGAGSTIDENALSSAVGSPTDWGTQCCRMSIAATLTFVYNLFGNIPLGYTRIEAVLTDLSALTASGDYVSIAFTTNETLTVGCWHVLVRNNGTNTALRLVYFYNGTSSSYNIEGPVVSEDTLYRIEVKWDYTNSRIDWRVNGVDQTGGDLSSGRSQFGGIAIGGPEANDGGEYYADLIAIDNADWVGAESITTLLPIRFNIDEISKGVGPITAAQLGGILVGG